MGQIPIPLTDVFAEKIKGIQSKFRNTQGIKTLAGTRVAREPLQVDASFVKIMNPTWNSILDQFVEQIAEGATFAIQTVVQEGALIVGLVIVMLLHSWQLTVLFIRKFFVWRNRIRVQPHLTD